MDKKIENKEVETSKNNKKRNIILVVVGLILLVIILFLLWFFNRKFEVTFDYNNGTKNETVLVKYNKTILEKDIKTKDDLGSNFINWYLVLEEKDGKEVLADTPFDFDTKIDEEIKLKAVYEGKVETVTIKFDSKGGSKVKSITINKGAELTLPQNPTYNGYTFEGWVDSNNRPVSNKTKFSADATLSAKWKKVEVKKEEPKKEETKVEEPKKEETKPEVKKEEKISLSLSNNYMHRKGTKTSRATASTENASGAVTYSLSSNICAKINSSTGVITAVTDSELEDDSMAAQICEVGQTVTVTATLPSGKSASKTLTLEKDLDAAVGNWRFYSGDREKGFEHNRDGSFTITTNMDVNWSVSGAVKGSTSAYGSTYNGKMINQDNGEARFTITSKGGQRIELLCQYRAN